MTEQEHGSVAMGDIGAIEEAKSIAADINSLLPGEMRQMTFWHNAALKMAAALSRPAQEPVAWRHRLVGADEWNLGQEGSMQHARSYQKLFPDKIEIEPLYAAPQPAHGTSATERVPSDQRVLFGLEAQGHIPTVEAALSEGTDWQEIGRRIGWDGETARQYYERHLARAALATPTPKEESK